MMLNWTALPPVQKCHPNLSVHAQHWANLHLCPTRHFPVPALTGSCTPPEWHPCPSATPKLNFALFMLRLQLIESRSEHGRETSPCSWTQPSLCFWKAKSNRMECRAKGAMVPAPAFTCQKLCCCTSALIPFQHGETTDLAHQASS